MPEPKNVYISPSLAQQIRARQAELDAGRAEAAAQVRARLVRYSEGEQTALNDAYIRDRMNRRLSWGDPSQDRDDFLAFMDRVESGQGYGLDANIFLDAHRQQRELGNRPQRSVPPSHAADALGYLAAQGSGIGQLQGNRTWLERRLAATQQAQADVQAEMARRMQGQGQGRQLPGYYDALRQSLGGPPPRQPAPAKPVKKADTSEPGERVLDLEE